MSFQIHSRYCAILSFPAFFPRHDSHLIFRHTHLPKSDFPLKLAPIGSDCRGRLKSVSCSATTLFSRTESFYDILGISESGNIGEIKKAYKKLARKYHPDVSPREKIEENTSRFIEVHEAYEILSDPRSRALYDGNLARGLLVSFPAKNQFNYGEIVVKRKEWRNRWEIQLSELKRRSENKRV